MSTAKQFGSAARLVDELGLAEPSDIRIEAISQYCGATVMYEQLTGCAARIIGSGNKAIITVDSSSPRTRQRFSAAHELGHWMRDRGKAAFACSERTLTSEWSGHNPEARANRFAAELLMPDKMFDSAARGKPVTFETTEQLASVFDTSLTATAIRLVERSLPSLLICSRAGVRRWFVKGPDIPKFIWPLDSPTEYTVASDLFKGKQTTTPNEIRADSWLNFGGASHYYLVEDSRLFRDGTVLTLLWWKNERKLIELSEAEEEHSN
jgi:hypothetical protein